MEDVARNLHVNTVCSNIKCVQGETNMVRYKNLTVPTISSYKLRIMITEQEELGIMLEGKVK